jgi:predicted metalloprotease with PDZ domain
VGARGLNRRDLCRLGLLGLTGGGSARGADVAAATTLRLGGGEIVLTLSGDFPAATRKEIQVWIKRSVDALVRYFGRLPAPRIELRLQAEPGHGVGGGTTDRDPALFVAARVGRDTTAAEFLDDWVLVHEMVHVAVPRLPRAQNWLHEGLATYVETVARARAGVTSAEQLWSELSRGMPQGLPRAGDRGLDRTHTWGRTYWGGAIFCLLADLKIRRASKGRSGLQQALQGVLAAGGNYGEDWSVTQFLGVADAAVGQTSLGDLYNEMKDQPMPVDLEALWRELGVVQRSGGAAVQFDDAAPEAWLRRAIGG